MTPEEFLQYVTRYANPECEACRGKGYVKSRDDAGVKQAPKMCPRCFDPKGKPRDQVKEA